MFPYPLLLGAPTFDAGHTFAMMASVFVSLVEVFFRFQAHSFLYQHCNFYGLNLIFFFRCFDSDLLLQFSTLWSLFCSLQTSQCNITSCFSLESWSWLAGICAYTDTIMCLDVYIHINIFVPVMTHMDGFVCVIKSCTFYTS
jgi:hypothetical protein